MNCHSFGYLLCRKQLRPWPLLFFFFFLQLNISHGRLFVGCSSYFLPLKEPRASGPSFGLMHPARDQILLPVSQSVSQSVSNHTHTHTHTHHADETTRSGNVPRLYPSLHFFRRTQLSGIRSSSTDKNDGYAYCSLPVQVGYSRCGGSSGSCSPLPVP